MASARANRDALLLTAGQIVRFVLDAIGEIDGFEQLPGARLGSLPRKAGETHGDGDILERAQTRQQVERLEDDADFTEPVFAECATVERGDIGPAERDRAVRRLEDRSHRREQRGLAASAGTEEQHERARRDFEIESVDRSYDIAAAGVLDRELRDEQLLVPLGSDWLHFSRRTRVRDRWPLLCARRRCCRAVQRPARRPGSAGNCGRGSRR